MFLYLSLIFVVLIRMFFRDVFVLGIPVLMYKILVARPSVHISYGIGEIQREQRSDQLNTGNANSDASDRLVPLLIQL